MVVNFSLSLKDWYAGYWNKSGLLDSVEGKELNVGKYMVSVERKELLG